MVRLDLSRGFVALVDDADGPRCQEVKWWTRTERGRVWAMSRHGPLHKYLTGWNRVGFVNDNPLDCRRSNLYQPKRMIGTYIYPLANGRYRLMVGNRTVGTFDTEQQAWEVVKRGEVLAKSRQAG